MLDEEGATSVLVAKLPVTQTQTQTKETLGIAIGQSVVAANLPFIATAQSESLTGKSNSLHA